MWRAAVPLTLVLALPASAVASTSLIEAGAAPGTAAPVQLDGDPEVERVVVDGIDEFRRQVVVEDSCGGHVRRLPLGRPQERVAVVVLDVPGRVQLLYSGSTGATGRVQQARAVRLALPIAERPCPGLQTTFRSPARTGPFALPQRHRGAALGGYGVVDRRAGAVDRLHQHAAYYGRQDPGCCPRWTRSVTWRWSPSADRWVRRGAPRYRRVPRP